MSDPKTEQDQLEAALEEAPAADPKPTKKKAASKKKAPAKKPAAEPEAEPKAAEVETSSAVDARAEKQKADAERREKAIADAPRPPDPSAEDLAEQERKAQLREKMAEIQDEVDDLEAAVQAKKEELRATSAELYPHLERSDHHVDAVKGYVESQKKLRATRASSPARIKAILEAAGRAPIDQAFQAQRARGAKRPARPAAQVKETGGDAAPDATPGED